MFSVFVVVVVGGGVLELSIAVFDFLKKAINTSRLGLLHSFTC